ERLCTPSLTRSSPAIALKAPSVAQRSFQPSLRYFVIPGKLGAPPTCSRRVFAHAESEQCATNAILLSSRRTSPVDFDGTRDNQTHEEFLRRLGDDHRQNARLG